MHIMRKNMKIFLQTMHVTILLCIKILVVKIFLIQNSVKNLFHYLGAIQGWGDGAKNCSQSSINPLSVSNVLVNLIFWFVNRKNGYAIKSLSSPTCLYVLCSIIIGYGKVVLI